MHHRAGNESKTIVDSQLGGAGEHASSENNWLLYARMLGVPTLVCLAAITVLHQLQCELASQPTHWLAALLLVALSAIGFAVLGLDALRNSIHSVTITGVCVLALALSLLFLDLCDEHRAFFAVMLAINTVACCLFVQRIRHHLPADKSRRAERQQDGRRGDSSP